MKLAKAQKNLTFNINYLDRKYKETTDTPFNEINIADPLLYITADKFNLQNKFNGTYEEYLDQVLKKLEKLLLRLNPNEKYLFSHSSGSDSRIISSVMACLKAQGKAKFDNVLFFCWGRPEEELFLKLMKMGGWDNFIIKDDFMDNAFDVGEEGTSVNGWNSYMSQSKFWKGIRGKGDINRSEYIFLSGADSYAFEATYDKWVHARTFFSDRGESIHRLSDIFKDTLFPFLTYEILNLNFMIPPEWKNIPDPKINRDKIRTDLVGKLGLLHIPAQTLSYNLNFTEDRKKKMINLFNKSKFKKDYKVEIDFNDLFKNRQSWSARAWGFAVTVYEKLI